MQLVARARLRKRLLASERSEQQRWKKTMVFGKDEGAGFAAMLMAPNKLKGYSEKLVDPERAWFVELERRYEWSHMLLSNGQAIADPGPFAGRTQRAGKAISLRSRFEPDYCS
jgi:hypothetical protein